jgi:hypothetical protein
MAATHKRAQPVGVLGAVAQLGERLVRNEEVRGSIPLGSTTPSERQDSSHGVEAEANGRIIAHDRASFLGGAGFNRRTGPVAQLPN